MRTSLGKSGVRKLRRSRGLLKTILPLSVIAFATCHGQDCPQGSRALAGRLVDTTGAVIVGAHLQIGGAQPLRSDKDGRFNSSCLALGAKDIQVAAAGFASVDATFQLTLKSEPLVISMKPEAVETIVEVGQTGGIDAADFAGSKTLSETDLKGLADDRDELTRQLQVLAAASGGAPGQATLSVDGFQNGSRMPPKSSIAFIRVNPDLFSAEYEKAPYTGGRIEVYTKPGLSKFHGALFTTLSNPWMNAKDPYALSRASLGRRQFGGEFSGPLLARKSDISVVFEHRQIDQFAVINAIVLNEAKTPVPYVANVPAPQSLYTGSARLGWMVTPKNNLTASYNADINDLQNRGVGGTALESTGYSSTQSEHVLHLSDLHTISATVLHEVRLGYTLRGRTDTPISTGPAVQVAGAFSTGGALTQNLRVRERDVEFDEDVLVSARAHSLKLGVELLDIGLDDILPTNFNGSRIFGGGAVRTATKLLDGTTIPAGTIISGLQQYHLGLPPTVLSVTTGSPGVALHQFRAVLYGQDQWKLTRRVSLSLGLRYAFQSAPVSVTNAGPRAGMTWALDKKQTWVLHARAGLFDTPVEVTTSEEAIRLDGTAHQTQSQSYPLSGSTTAITTTRRSLSNLQQPASLQLHLGLEKELPGHWHVQANLYRAQSWSMIRTVNINTPTDSSNPASRPFGSTQNILQFQQSASLHGNVLYLGLDQRSLKRLQIFAAYIRLDLRSNTDTDLSSPQSNIETAAANRSETSRPSWEATHHLIVFSTLNLPRKVSLALQFDAASGLPFNITTGFDNNGDGIFNDRPVYASAADLTGKNWVQTKYGKFAYAGTGPAIYRNAGTLPWNFHADVNLNRSFNLGRDPQTGSKALAVNLRFTNLLNHNNVATVGGVLGSPLFGRGIVSSPGRRVEVGLRYSF